MVRMIKWMFIIVIMVTTLSLNGCADTADAESSAAITPVENQEVTTNTTNDETIWVAIVLTWNPVKRTIDKEFSTEVNCWNYYDTGAGENEMRSRYGTQVLDHQGNKPDKDYMKKHRPAHREYPTRMYKNFGADLVWLTCDIKGRNEGL